MISNKSAYLNDAIYRFCCYLNRFIKCTEFYIVNGLRYSFQTSYIIEIRLTIFILDQ